MKIRLFQSLAIALLCLGTTSCFSRTQASCDLDQILDIFVVHLKSGKKSIRNFQDLLNNVQSNAEINKRITADFNPANDAPTKILVRERRDGAIEGWSDMNFSGHIDGADRKLFLIEIDYPNKRIIATDETSTGTYHRTRTPTVFAYYWVSRMSARQKGSLGKHKSFSNLNTRKKGYFSRSRNPRARSIRSRSFGSFGGSRSFMGGK